MSYDNSAPPPPSGYGAVGPQGAPPENYLVWSILTTILCCLPAGIVAIVYSAQVNSKWQAGDVAGARSASANAKKWAIIAAVAGLAVVILWAVLLAVGILSLSGTQGDM